MDKILDKINKFVPTKWRWVLDHSGFRRYFKNTGWMFFGQMFSLLVSFFIGAWLARYLGPENYGIFNYAMAFVGLFSFIAPLGIDSILSRNLINNPEKYNELLGTSFILKIIGGTFAFLLVVLSIIFFHTSPLIKLMIILFSLSFILQAINVISIYFQAEVKSKNNVKALLFATAVSSLLKIFIILSGKGVIWVIAVYVLDFLWQGIGFVIAYKNYGLKIKNWKFNKSIALKMLKSSWLLMLSSAAGFIYLKVDQVIIGTFLGSRDVGLYAAAVKFAEIWYFIPGIVCTSLFPAIVNAKKTSNVIYRKRLNMLYKLMAILALFIIIFIVIFAPFVIKLFFGKEYLKSIYILRVYIFSSIGFFVNFSIIQYYLIENRINYIFYYNFFIMIINVILNIFLINYYGLAGAAYATLISYSLGPILFFANEFKKYNLDY